MRSPAKPRDQLAAYLVDAEFVPALPLHPAGTPFQRRVWQQIAAIPTHQTRTYGEIAKALHNAPRAVGQACGANPFPVIVPCHRVVATAGGLGGFAGQRAGFLLDVKRWLLAHEGC
jgi:methylated-DNA-[protein]-cysteine S-methyltransferase